MAETRKEQQADWVDFKEIKEKVPLEVVLLQLDLLKDMRKSGDEWIGNCPFHENKPGKNPFYDNVKKNTFHCFACKQSGNVLDFTSKYRKTGLKEAGQWLVQLLEKGLGEERESTKPTGFDEATQEMVAELAKKYNLSEEEIGALAEELMEELLDMIMRVVEKHKPKTLAQWFAKWLVQVMKSKNS